MKTITVFLFTSLLLAFRAPVENNRAVKMCNDTTDTIPVALPANFMDDYGIRYTVTDTLFQQHPNSKYHILRWNKEKQYIIARNGINNSTDKGLYTRIDYMRFSNMEPFLWGFCLSVYNAVSDSLAEFGPDKTDRANPRKGCNGFPFSRMKKVD